MRNRTKRKFFAVVLAIAMMISQAGFAFADDGKAEVQGDAVVTEQVAEVEEPVVEEPAKEEPVVEEQEEPAPVEEPVVEPAPVEEVVVEQPAEPAPEPEKAVEEPVPAAVDEPQEEQAAQAAEPAETKKETKKTESNKTVSEKKSTKKEETKKAPTMAESFEFDNSTKLTDGTYTSDDIEFTWEGGTGKARLNMVKLVVKNGKATAEFTASSTSLTHVYLKKTDSNNEDTSIYDPATDTMADGVYAIKDQKVTIPVKVNEKTDLAMRSVAMTEPHWINYQYTITVEEPEEFVFDNSTTIADGLYTSDVFEYTFTGGTGKAKLTCESVSVKDGKATGTFVSSSTNMTHVYLAASPSNDEVTSLYDPSKDRMGPGVYAIESTRVTIPVKLNAETDIAARSVAMTEPHWINYKYTITISEEAESEFDNTTDLKDGTYTPDDYTFEGGTGKAKLTCTKVTVKDGRATGEFKSSSANMTHVYLGEATSNNEDKSLYDPETGKMGSNVYEIKDQTVTVPVKLNVKEPIAARSVAMSEPHWINYTYKITVKENSETDPPVDPSDKDKDKDKDKDDKDRTPSTKQKLKDGTYKVLSTTCRVMFYLNPKDEDPTYSILTIKDGKMTATITLSGDGYDYVYMGTPAQAKKAGKKNWIKAKVVNGYYTFTIPVSALDKKLPITPRSHKYATDGDPSTDPWRPDKWIKFYSGDAIKIKDGTKPIVPDKPKKEDKDKEEGKTSGEQTDFHNDNKEDKESKWQDDSSASTGVVDSKTTLKDGVYTPDSFSWSGGSGRLAYIRCNKITVTNGQAYATIEFSSPNYDQLKANGRIYYKNGGGNSTFVIPVNLNANNTIIGRTTAMSQPHWIKYTIYIGKSEDAKKAQEAKEEAAKAKMEISEEAPEIQGLKVAEDEEEVETYSKYFKIFNYEDGVKLLSIDISKDTELKKEYTKNAKKAIEISKDEDSLEYDDEGNIIAKSQNEYIEGLYKNNVINYLLVPEDYEVPAGLDKEYIIIRVPSEKSFMASQEAIDFMTELGCLDKISLVGMDEEELDSKDLKKAIEDEDVLLAGNMERPDYAKVVRDKSDLAVLPGTLLPEKIAKDADNKDELKAEAEAKKAELEKLESRFTALGVPVIVDRSAQEEDELGQAEWIKVYGALYGCEEEAAKIFEKIVEEAEKE